MRVPSVQEFCESFSFNPQKSFLVGVERECFLTQNGKVAPIAQRILSYLKDCCPERYLCYGYELSACQLEDRTERPCRPQDVKELFEKNDENIRKVEQYIPFSRLFCGTGPEDMPLDHYPDPRYDQIVQQMSSEALRAACRVTGVHIHVGMPNHQTALSVYNNVVRHFPMLCRVGCSSFDGRLDNYQIVVNSFGTKDMYSDRIMLFMNHLVGGVYQPPTYRNWLEFYNRAVREGFATDPRRLWDFIRISKHGTIEFRMFDSTDDLDQISFWASLCLSLCTS